MLLERIDKEFERDWVLVFHATPKRGTKLAAAIVAVGVIVAGVTLGFSSISLQDIFNPVSFEKTDITPGGGASMIIQHK